MGIPKILPTFFIGNSTQVTHFFGRESKEDMEIPNFFFFLSYLVEKMEFPIFTNFCKEKNANFHFFQILESQFLKVKIQAWEFLHF